MADEITYTIELELENGELTESLSANATLDQATQGSHKPTVIVGTTAEEDLNLGDLATPGLFAIKNLTVAPSTTYVRYGPKSGGSMIPFGKLKAGQTHLVYLATGVTVRMRAYGAQSKVQVTAAEA